MISNHVSRNVMDYISNKSVNTLHLRVEKVDNLNYKVYSGRKDYLLVSKKDENDIWLCECEESLRIKLPCIHELCVCIKF
jgi:hypothetical protein